MDQKKQRENNKVIDTKSSLQKTLKTQEEESISKMLNDYSPAAIEADINKRIRLRNEIELFLKRKLQRYKDKSKCSFLWNQDRPIKMVKWYEDDEDEKTPNVFVKVSGEKTTKLGQGSYGSVYRIDLPLSKKYPCYVAMKKTNTMDIEEPNKIIQTSALVELKINPHFLMFYGHVRCTLDIKSDKIVQNLSWTQATDIIMRLNQDRAVQVHLLKMYQMKSNPEDKKIIKEIQSIENNIKEINHKIQNYRRIYVPSEQEFKEIEKYKIKLFEPIHNKSEEERNEAYKLWKNEWRFRHDPIPEHLKSFFEYFLVEQTYNQMYFKRIGTNARYELILMEYANENFDKLIEKYHKNDDFPSSRWVTMFFQICSAFLSMLYFYDMLQNDLLLHNIMVHTVPKDALKEYKYVVNNLEITVPINQYICKVIDFGLSTAASLFDTYDPNYPLRHWCPGGKGLGPDFTKYACKSRTRDFLELFFRLRKNSRFFYSKKRHANLYKWMEWAETMLREAPDSSFETAKELIIRIFDPIELMKRFSIESNMIYRTLSAEEMSSLIPDAFYIINPDPKVQRRLDNLIMEKEIYI